MNVGNAYDAVADTSVTLTKSDRARIMADNGVTDVRFVAARCHSKAVEAPCLARRQQFLSPFLVHMCGQFIDVKV